MAKGNSIIVSVNPKGKFWEGTIRTAEKPGTVVQLDVSEGLDANGWPQWEVYAPGTDGNRLPIAVLLHDSIQGKLATDAYVAGDHCFVYFPTPGEQLNMLYKNVAGTADDVAFGDLMIVDDSTGKLIVTTGSPEAEPFQSLEIVTDPTADQLIHCLFTGY